MGFERERSCSQFEGDWRAVAREDMRDEHCA